MQKEKTVLNLKFKISANVFFAAAVSFFLVWSPGTLMSNLNITSYYPSPYGAYSSVIATGDTFLGRERIKSTSAVDTGVLVKMPAGSPETNYTLMAVYATSTSQRGLMIRYNNYGLYMDGLVYTTGNSYLSSGYYQGMEVNNISGLMFAIGSEQHTSSYMPFMLFNRNGNSIYMYSDLAVSETSAPFVNLCTTVSFGIGSSATCPTGTSLFGIRPNDTSYNVYFAGETYPGNGTYQQLMWDVGFAGTMVCCKISMD